MATPSNFRPSFKLLENQKNSGKKHPNIVKNSLKKFGEVQGSTLSLKFLIFFELIFWSETTSNKSRIDYNDHPEQFQTEF